jgi:hypothetical protein
MLPAALLALLAVWAPGSPAPGEPLSDALEDAVCCGHGRYGPAVDLFETEARRGAPGPKARYLAASAYIRLHLHERAEPLLEGLDGEVLPGWEKAESLRLAAAAFRASSPPAAKDRSVPGIEVFSGPPTAWTAPVLSALPEWLVVGRRVFGERLPRVRFFLFSDRRAYLRFYEAAFRQAPGASWQDGTGDAHIVVYCEAPSRAAGIPETLGTVLHEFGHAWMSTYVARAHGREYLSPALRRPYLDEGLADLFASMWDGGYLGRRREWLRTKKVAAGKPAPPFEELRTLEGFYRRGDAHTHYWLSALLAGRLLGGPRAGPERIPVLLDALARTSDDRAAWHAACGKDPAEEYRALVRDIWAR